MEASVSLNINETEMECLVTYNWTPYLPGIYSAAPENCFEAEPEDFELHLMSTVYLDKEYDVTPLIECYEDEIISQIKDYQDEILPSM